MTHDHLDSDLVAAYAEGRLDPQGQALVESHAADCADCRRDLADLARILAASRRRRRWAVAAPAVAAAVVAIVVLRPGRPAGGTIYAVDSLRPGSTSAEGLPALAAYLPATGAPTARADLRFIWGSGGPDALYDLTVADSAGNVVWRLRTSDTVVAPPDSVSLGAGARYHWWVDVLLPDGRVATTGNREFQMQP